MSTVTPLEPQVIDPAAQANAEAAFRDAHPTFGSTAILDELRAHRVRAPRRPRPRLPRLHRRRPVRGVAARGAPAARCATASSATRTRSTRRRRRRPRSSSGRAPPCCASSTPRRTSTSASSRRTPPARCGSSARRTRSGRGGRFLRRSTTTTRSTASASSRGRRARARRTCRSSRPTCASTDATLERHLDARRAARHNLFAFPAQSNFSGVKHPLEWIARGPRARLGRAARLRRVRADEPARPVDVQAGLRGDLLLQDVRLPDRASAPARARARRSTRLRRRGSPAARSSPRPSRATGRCRTSGQARLRGRHPRLPRHPGRRDRPAPSRADRRRHDPRRVEALGTWLLEALQRLRHSDGRPATASTGRATWDRRGPPSRCNFLHPDGRVVDERFVDLLAAAHTSRSGPAASATPAPARSRSRCREERMIGVELSDGMSSTTTSRASACPRAVRCGCRSGSRATSPTSTGSCRSPRSSATSPTCRGVSRPGWAASSTRTR